MNWLFISRVATVLGRTGASKVRCLLTDEEKAWTRIYVPPGSREDSERKEGEE